MAFRRQHIRSHVYCVDYWDEWRREWRKGEENARGQCHVDRAAARVAARDFRYNNGCPTRVRRVETFCQCWVGDTRVDDLS